MATEGKRDIVLTSIEVRKDGEFLGYVRKVTGTGAYVYCTIVSSWKPKFATRKGQSVCGAARAASVCSHEDGRKFYPRKDNLTFRTVLYH